MSSTFEILMNQIDMPLDMRQSSAFLHAEIEQVLVHTVSHVWEFQFVFGEILPIELFQKIKKRLNEEFSKTGTQAIFEIRLPIQILQSCCRLITKRLLQKDLAPVRAFVVCTNS